MGKKLIKIRITPLLAASRAKIRREHYPTKQED